MHTADMTAESAWYFFDEITAALEHEGMTPAEREQYTWDLEDVSNRLQELESHRCPKCGVIDGPVESGSSGGFTGAPIYWVNWKCCGHQESDHSADDLSAVE